MFNVVVFSEYGEMTYHNTFDTPAEAIEMWFMMDSFNPTMTSIQAYNKEKAIELIKWASDNTDKIEEFNDKYPCHIKLHYLTKFIEEQKNKQCRTFIDTWDNIHPFCMG